MSNYYFPAVAAVELGFLQTQGIDMELDMVFPVGRAMEALRDRRVDFVAGPAHATWMESNLMYYFLPNLFRARKRELRLWSVGR